MIKLNWNEKYRVFHLDEIKGQDIAVKMLKGQSSKIRNGKDGDCPHMLFAGKEGIGKTTALYAFLIDTFGKDYLNSCLLERNASDEARVEDLRGKVKNFAKGKSNFEYYEVNGEQKNVPFRIVFLDEVDYLPKSSQAILRRMMEDNATTCRFVLSCNYSSKIISPIKDRCVLIPFKPLRSHAIKEMLNVIVEGENISITKSALHMISLLSKGSARKAQNDLYSATLLDDNINDNIIYQVTNTQADDIIKELLMYIGKQNEDYNKFSKLIDDEIDELFWDLGMTYDQILEKLFTAISESKNINYKKEMLPKIGVALTNSTLSNNPCLSLKCFIKDLG